MIEDRLDRELLTLDRVRPSVLFHQDRLDHTITPRLSRPRARPIQFNSPK
jgi:hypothetical protein